MATEQGKPPIENTLILNELGNTVALGTRAVATIGEPLGTIHP